MVNPRLSCGWRRYMNFQRVKPSSKPTLWHCIYAAPQRNEQCCARPAFRTAVGNLSLSTRHLMISSTIAETAFRASFDVKRCSAISHTVTVLCVHCRLLLMLWTALSPTCVQAQLCSSNLLATTVATAKDAAKLATAALCDNAIITAAWQGNVPLAETLVVGNGTSLTVTGASAKTAIIDGGSAVQLFHVWGELNLINMTLTNGYAEYGGAIFHRANTKVVINGSVFKGHEASYGGAISSDSNSTLTITDCQFSDNKCSGDGGAIYCDMDSALMVSKTTFDSNTAEQSGGCVFSDLDSTVDVTSCMFSNNTANLAPVMYLDSAVVNIKVSQFIGNHALNGSGAVVIVADSSAHISSSSFSNNTAQSGAAVVAGSGATITITSSQFSFNNASAGGGSVCTESDTALTVTNSTFTANAAVNGGGIYASGNTAITDSQLSDHTALYGAAVLIDKNQTATFSGCTFTSNYATSTAGAVYVEESCTVVLDYCGFVNNTAQYNAGSILAYTKSHVNVTSSSFTCGHAAVGGAMIASTESIVTLKDVHMSSNTAVDGGAISVQSVLYVYVYDSSFTNNTAASRGGAIVGDAQSGILLRNTSFTNNRSQGNGGAIQTAGELKLESCNLISNSGLSGGAIYTDNTANIGMKNCVLTHNTAQQSACVERDPKIMRATAVAVATLNPNIEVAVTGGAWFGFGTEPDIALETTLITNSSAACCFASGYGAQLPSNTTLTCSDTDSGENRGDCCYNSQYSDGTRCVTCKVGTDCSVVGTSLATQSLVHGYWRAATTSTDVRPCWFADACTGNRNENSSNSTSGADTTTTSTSSIVRGITQVDDATYCAQGYKGPCEHYTLDAM
eukprot:18536-Heterococcus_DN1.PRE.5